MKTRLIILFAGLMFQPAFGQEVSLRSYKHGWNLVFGENISSAVLLNDLKFFDGPRNENDIEVLRIDNQGNSLVDMGPLVLSSYKPVWSDSLGLTGVQIKSDSMRSLLLLIRSLDTKNIRMVASTVRFRISYRYGGETYQYHVGHAANVIEFFKKIEKKLILMNDKDALNRFHRWLLPSKLIRNYSGYFVWQST